MGCAPRREGTAAGNVVATMTASRSSSPCPGRIRRTCATRLRYQHDTVIQFIRTRTREVLIELKMVDGALITWGKTSLRA